MRAIGMNWSGWICAAAFCQLAVPGQAQNPYQAWWFRRTIAVTNANATTLTNHQVQVTLDTAALIAAGKMRSDGGDLRFAGASDSALSYWVEPGSMNTSTTRVWVKTGVLAADSASTLFAYYGQPQAVSISSGEDTFDFYEDFDGATINATRWPSQALGGMIYPTNGMLQVNRVAGTNYHITSRTFTQAEFPLLAECRTKSATLPANGWCPLGLWSTAGRWVAFLHHPGPRLYIGADSWETYLTPPVTEFHKLGIAVITPTNVEFRAAFETTTSASFTNSRACTSRAPHEYSLRIVSRYDYTASQAVSAQIDWIRVRRYAAVEPLATVGSESPAGTVWTISGRVENRLGFGIPGVAVWFAADMGVATDDSGAYTFQVPSGWNGTVTPEWAASFAPSNRSYANVTGNQTNQNFLLHYGVSSYTNWIFSREVRIGNSGAVALTNHQVLVEVDTAALIAQGKMRTDGGDIRFVDVGDRPLDYWAEPETVNATRTRIWVKMPLLPAGQTTLIYLRHGQPAAVSAANGEAVFEFFDGFEGADVDTSKWTIVNATGWSVANGSLRGVDNMGRLSSKSTFSQGVVLETRMRATALAPHGHMVGGFWKSTTDNYGYLYYPTTDYMVNNGAFGAIGSSLPLNEPYRFTVETISASQVNYAMVRASDGLQMKGAVANNAVVNESVVLGQRYNNTYGGFAYDGYWDHVFVRKYAVMEPTVTYGKESTGGILSYMISGVATNRWGQGIEGVRIGFGTNTATWTTNGGGYAFRVAHGWSGTATPTYSAGGTFTPASISHSSVTADRVNQNYGWAGPTYTLSGTVRNQQTGAGVGGATLTLQPGALTATTAANGEYALAVEHARSGALKAAFSAGTLSPSSYALAPMTGAVGEVDFNWLPDRATDTNTILLIHSSAANGSTAFADSSAYAHAVNRIGDVAHRTATKAIGSSSMQFDGQGDALAVPDSDAFDLGAGDFTMDFWVRGDRGDHSAAAETLLAQWSENAAGFTNSVDWASYNAASVGGLATRGYRGAVFDGRYIYFVPHYNGAYHGNVLRFDTQGEMGSASSWASFNAANIGGLNTVGYVGGVFDGRYIYFVPYNNGTSGIVLRYDTQGEFNQSSSWASFNAGNVGGLNTKGYMGAVFDGRYILFVPYYNGTYHANVLRYDTTGDFGSAENWSSRNAGTTDGRTTIGYLAATFDGRYVYFAPHASANNVYHGIVLRFDTRQNFDEASAWNSYDAGNVGGLNTKGYGGSVFDGRYVYFTPTTYAASTYHGHVLRLDTQGDFEAAGSWESYNAGNVGGLNTKGYMGAVFDGRFVYFTPYNNGSHHGNVLRLDTQGEFNAGGSWSSFNASAIGGLSTYGYLGAIYDGRHVYFTPYYSSAYHGNVLRYDTAPQGAFKLNWRQPDPSGSYSAVPQGLTCTLGAGSKAYTLLASGNMPPNEWHHVAVTRNGSTLRLFMDGLVKASCDMGQATVNSSPAPVTAGAGADQARGFNGYLDEIRIARGTARWTGLFADELPTQPYPDARTVSGRVRHVGRDEGVDNVSLSLGPWSTLTAGGGGYTSRVAFGWSGTIAVSHPAGGLFTPPSRTAGPVLSSLPGQDFQWQGPPTITAIAPSSGVRTGGETVFIDGTNFMFDPSLPQVFFGGMEAISVTRIHAGRLMVTTPAYGREEVVSVQILNANGLQAVLTNGFTFTLPTFTATGLSPASGPFQGGTRVTIPGSGLLNDTYGTGADGSVIVSNTVNLNTQSLVSGRSFPDAPAYSVIGLTDNAATLSEIPASGTLAEGDEVLLINLQGTASAYANVGNYEFLRVAQVDGAIVRFQAFKKSKYYGDQAGDDSNLGTGAANQRVILQRVPNYQNLTVLAGGTLTVNQWAGAGGGVLCLRVAGAMTNFGTISVDGAGYRGSTGGATQGESYNANTGVRSQAANLGGGGGGMTSVNHVGGAGGGGHGVAGTGGWASTYSGGRYSNGGGNAGDGGAAYGDGTLSKLFFGSGGGGGNSAGYYGGDGGGIIYVAARTFDNTGAFSAKGANGRNGASEVGAGGGGAGGSLYLQGNQMTLGTGLVSVAGGAGGGSSYAGGSTAGGPGGSGRLALNYVSSYSGTYVSSAASVQQVSNVEYRVRFGESFGAILDATATDLLVSSPPGPGGCVDVYVVNVDGATEGYAGQFCYLPGIIGRVTNFYSGAGVGNVTLRAEGVEPALTDTNGNFQVLVPFGWAGELRATADPEDGLGFFNPEFREYWDYQDTNRSGQDFSWIPELPIVSGWVINGVTEEALAGATVTLSGGAGSVATDTNGYYSKTMPYAWTGTISVSYSSPYGAGTWTPPIRAITNKLVRHLADQDFAWNPPYYPGTRYVSLTGLNQYPYTNLTMAARDIQTAINAAGTGDMVRVADGTYNVSKAIKINRRVTVQSINGPNWAIIQRSSGDAGVVLMTVSNAVLDGFTIQNGYRSPFMKTNSTGTAGGAGLSGGAIIMNCIIRSNHVFSSTPYAAGLDLDNGSLAYNCLIYGNVAHWSTVNLRANFAGGANVTRNSRLVNCTVYGNARTGSGSGAGGITGDDGVGYVDNCIVWGNTGGNVSTYEFQGSTRGSLQLRSTTYQNASGNCTIDDMCASNNPLFVNAGATDFRLQPESLSINSGSTNYNATTNDLFRNPRVRFVIDRGPIEYTNAMPGVEGRITNEYFGTGVSGVTISLANGATATSGDGGWYRVLTGTGYTGTVTPSYGTGWFLAPASRSVTNLTNSVTGQNFSWRPPHPTVSGKVTHLYTGAGLDGVSLTFSGGMGNTLTTNGGQFSHTVTGRWTGTVSASHALGGGMSPASLFLTNVIQNRPDMNFVWTPITHVVSGRATHRYTGAGVDGVTLSFNAGGGSVVTSNGGYFAHAIYHDYTGRATPSLAGGYFENPSYRTFSSVTGGVAEQDFVWTPVDPVISGRITNVYNGSGRGGIALTFSNGGGLALTASDGTYSCIVPWNWSGTATPSHPYGVFQPIQESYAGVQTSLTAENFGWQPDVRTVSGRLTNLDSGAGLDGIEVNFTDGGGSATTANGGYYSRNLYYSWSGLIYPAAKAGGQWQVGEHYISNLEVNASNLNFTWGADRPVSGRVTHQETGAGVSNVAIRFVSATETNAVNTDTNGYYTVMVTNRSAGDLQPGHAAATFSPASRALAAVTAPLTTQDFVFLPKRSLSGRVTHRDTDMPMANVAIALSTGGEPSMTDASGQYSLIVAQGWSGRATPSHSSGNFSPPYTDYTNVALDRPNQNYVWAPPRILSGQVTNTLTGAGLDGVVLTFAGGGITSTAATASGGYYARQILEGWSGHVSAARSGFVFSDPVYINGVSADISGIDFGGTPASVAVSGRIVNAYSGTGMPSRVVLFSGGGTATTDGHGYYSRQVSFGYSGTATVSSADGTYAPANRTYANLQLPRGGEDYTFVPYPRTISGVVTHGDTGEGLANVEIQISSGGSITTDADGAYSSILYQGWSGTLTPLPAEGIFIAALRTYSALAADQVNQNFAWYPNRVIAGQVRDEGTGEGVSGVAVRATGVADSAITDANGNYQILVPHGWNGQVVASNAAAVFSPTSHVLTNLTADVADKDFVRRIVRLVNGRVTHRYLGSGVAGATVTFSGAGTAVTAADGSFEHWVIYGYTGNLTPALAGGTFDPGSLSAGPVTNDLTGRNFIWTPVDPVISGRVVNVATEVGEPGIPVQFTPGGTVTTAVNGVFSRSVAYGWSGTIAPVPAEGVVYPPVVRQLADVTSDQSAGDFNWLPPDPIISGRITSQAGVGIDNVSIAVSSSDSILTTNGGYFSLTVPLHWTGTLLPVPIDADGTFSPVARAYTNLVVRLSNQDFVWQTQQRISGRVTNSVTGDGVGNFLLQLTNGVADVLTDADGDYEILVSPGWTGAVRPRPATGIASPAQRNYSNVLQPFAGQDYAWIPPAARGDRYVSPAGGHVYPFTNWAMALQSVESAIKAANKGETVWVSNGVYQLAEMLTVDKAIRVRSVNGAEQTVLRAATGARVLRLADANAEFRGFTLADANTAAAGAGASVDAGYLHSCIVRSNRSSSGAGGLKLGNAETARVANNLLYGNTGAGGYLGGIDGIGTVVNCTLAANSPAGIRASLVYNSIADGGVLATEVRYTLAPTAPAGIGNKGGDPKFVDPAARDYHLQPDSPALDAGRNDYNVLPFDLEYGPRVLNVVDMGAYERAPAHGLAVALASEPNPIPRGDELAYHLTVLNGGPGTALGVVVTSSLPAGTTYISNNVGAAYQLAGGVWSVGTLDAFDSTQMTLWVRADQPGYWTNGAVVTASQADPSEPGYDRAECVTRILADVVITNLAASTSSGNSTVKWDSVVGIGYSVYSSDGSVGLQDEPEWETRATMVASEQLRDFLDTDTASSEVTRRYYQVTYSGREPTASNMWALIRRDVRPGSYTLVSPPVRMDRRFDGELGRALAEVLNGHNGGIGSAADEVYILEGETWRMLYLDAAKTWREANGAASTCELAPGQGFWVARKSGTPARITFTGPVGNDGTMAKTLQPGFNLIGLSEGKDLPLKATFAKIDPLGAATEEGADQIVIQKPNGSWRRLMHVQGWGAPYDGNWFDLSTYQIVSAGEILEPGAAYYYLRRGAAAGLEF